MTISPTKEEGAPGGHYDTTAILQRTGSDDQHSHKTTTSATILKNLSQADTEPPHALLYPLAAPTTRSSPTPISQSFPQSNAGTSTPFNTSSAHQGHSTALPPAKILDARNLNLAQLSQTETERLRCFLDTLPERRSTAIAEINNKTVKSPRATTSTSWEETVGRNLSTYINAALKIAWYLISPFARYGVPILLALLFGFAALVITFLMFWIAVQSVGARASQQLCAHGLAKYSPLATYVGFGDFCVSNLKPTPAISLQDDDTTGLLSIMDSFPPGAADQLKSTWDTFEAMSSQARSVVSQTIYWDDADPNNTIHDRAVQYLSTQQHATDSVKELYMKHTIFMESITGDVRILSSSIERKIKDYNAFTYVLADRWYSMIPGLSVYSPLGRVKHDFKAFATYQLIEVGQMVTQTKDLLRAITTTEVALDRMTKKFNKEWLVWAKKCTQEKGSAVFGKKLVVVSEDISCYLWQPEEARQMLHGDPKNTFEMVKKHLKESLVSYHILETRYKSISGGLSARKTYVESTLTPDLISFQQSISEISKRILAATKKFDQSMHSGK